MKFRERFAEGGDDADGCAFDDVDGILLLKGTGEGDPFEEKWKDAIIFAPQ